MPKRRDIDVNANNGARVAINATIPCRFVEIYEGEDPTVPPQGLQYWTNEGGDGFATQHLAQPAENIQLGDKVAHQQGRGRLLGLPAYSSGGQDIAATKLIEVRSNTAVASKVTVVEYE